MPMSKKKENEKAIEYIRKLGSSQKEQVKRKNERV